MRKRTLISSLVAVLLTAIVAHAMVDTDEDGFLDDYDNCIEVANEGQQDSDGDGFGNICDGDLNNDCSVGLPDFGIFRACINMPGQAAKRGCEHADFNSDHKVNSLDFAIWEDMFAEGTIGPSGLATCY